MQTQNLHDRKFSLVWFSRVATTQCVVYMWTRCHSVKGEELELCRPRRDQMSVLIPQEENRSRVALHLFIIPHLHSGTRETEPTTHKNKAILYLMTENVFFFSSYFALSLNFQPMQTERRLKPA